MNSTRTDLALFCLTKLLILAEKSNGIKRMMLLNGIDRGVANPPEVSAFDAVMEAAQIYPRSAKIQQEVCGLLWSLSTKLQEHVATDSADKVVDTVLKGMLQHLRSLEVHKAA